MHIFPVTTTAPATASNATSSGDAEGFLAILGEALAATDATMSDELSLLEGLDTEEAEADDAVEGTVALPDLVLVIPERPPAGGGEAPLDAESAAIFESLTAALELDGVSPTEGRDEHDADTGGEVPSAVLGATPQGVGPVGDPAEDGAAPAPTDAPRIAPYLASRTDGETPASVEVPAGEAPGSLPPTPATAVTSEQEDQPSTTTSRAEPSRSVAPPDASTVQTPTSARPVPTTAAAVDPAAAAQLDAVDEDPWQQLATVVRPLRQLPDGTHRMSLQLRPAELGTVHLEVALDDGRLSLRAVADNAAARDVLASSMPDLRAELTRAGIDLGSLDVGPDTSGGEARDGDLAGRPAPHGGARGPAAATATTPDPIATGPTDPSGRLDLTL